MRVLDMMFAMCACNLLTKVYCSIRFGSIQDLEQTSLSEVPKRPESDRAIENRVNP
jgi:hypothetical protein